MTKKVGLVVGLLIVLAAGSARAGTNLAWNDCLGGGGLIDRTVACTNTGSVTLYLSFVTPSDIPNLAGIDAFVDVQAPSTVNSWWISNPVSNRWSGAVGVSPSGACPGWADGAPHGAIVFAPVIIQISGTRLRVRLSMVVQVGDEQDAAPGTEYLAGIFILKNSDGTAGNGECEHGAALGVNQLALLQPSVAEILMRTPEVSNCVTFQGGGGEICPGATPTRKATWGSLKALYR